MYLYRERKKHTQGHLTIAILKHTSEKDALKLNANVVLTARLFNLKLIVLVGNWA